MFKILEVRTLGRSRDELARELLNKAAAHVRPIMERRRWSVPLMEEFFPRNACLLGLNVNGGEKICVRLRPAAAPDTFYPYEDIVGTVLHELAHIVHGPHKDPFYKLLDEITAECERVLVPFAGEGHALPGRARPPADARAVAAAAAERRRQLEAPPRTVGGRPSPKSAAEAAARAALRRQQDALRCGTDAGAAEVPAGRAGAAAETPRELVPGEWTCAFCTFRNGKALAPVCEVCATARESTEPAAATTAAAAAACPPPAKMPCPDVAPCPSCTYHNVPSARVCDMCQTPLSLWDRRPAGQG
jgi:hypothetical protein